MAPPPDPVLTETDTVQTGTGPPPAISDPGLQRDIESLLDELGVGGLRGVVRDILTSALRLACEDHDRLDLKITAVALEEMRQAFLVFRPFRDVQKATVFGSARTRPEDPSYRLARELAAGLAQRGWMVVTGAGPGIMAAAAEGAGRSMSLGVNIRLPFEQQANEFVEDEARLVTMKYFFTRKLMLMKESAGFASLPGGFGTLDETLELLTLMQTGKAQPAPLVLAERPGGTFWSHFEGFVVDELLGAGMIAPADLRWWLRTTSVEEACEELTGFYANYHSLRYVGDRLVLRMRRRPSDELLARITEAARDVTVDGRVLRSGPLPPERDDVPHLARLVLRPVPRHQGRLRALIDLVNGA
jgi:uncharacterized protein (TIGR00730 family)